MAGSTNRWAFRWLRAQLPELIAAGAISSENAKAIERHYESAQSRSNFGFVLLAIVGSALVGAGIILLVAHNWDELSRTARSTIAFLPLVVSQALCFFVLQRRSESQPWRESVAIFNVAAVGTAISLISQTYQIQGTFASFMQVWLLLSIPIVYLLGTTFGAVVYLVGAVVWLFARESWFGQMLSPNLFWLFLLLILPYYMFRFRQDRNGRETARLSILLALAAAIGIGISAEFTRTNLGSLALAGLFTVVYLSGIRFFPKEGDRLHPLAFLGGFGIGVIAIVLSYESAWHFSSPVQWRSFGLSGNVAVGIELLFPLVAVVLALSEILRRGTARVSVMACALPVLAAIAWAIADFSPASSFLAAFLFDVYAFALGVEILVRGIRANSIARANFGLLVIAALAISRFFDTDLSFVIRGVGFIIVGVGFLVANVIFFKKRAIA
ncbi:MAG: DUF2157 domain-containing protein [Verrucomicrobiota bacterium]